jgi:hypothetical protein
MEKKKYVGKEELINNQWYSVSVTAYSIQEANKLLFKGMRKSYGTVQEIKGRWKINVN